MNYKLLVNPGQETQWEIPLEQGTTVLGSDPALPWPVNHGSVSAQHCQLEVGPDSVLVRDLGSERGTKIGDQVVSESNLFVGEKLRVGEIEFELAEAPRKITPPLAPAIPATPATRSIPKQAVDQTTIRSTWIYPMQGEGWIILLLGSLAGYAVGFIPLLPLAFAGYLFLYGKEIVCSTTQGHPTPPNWPIISNLKYDLLWPLLQYAGVTLVCLGPVMLLRCIGNPWEASMGKLPVMIATAIGIFFVPGGIALITLYDNLASLNPIAIFSLIAKIPKEYLMTALVFELILAADYVAGETVPSLLPIPIAGGVIGAFVHIYLFVVAMRNAGLLARRIS